MSERGMRLIRFTMQGGGIAAYRVADVKSARIDSAGVITVEIYGRETELLVSGPGYEEILAAIEGLAAPRPPTPQAIPGYYPKPPRSGRPRPG